MNASKTRAVRVIVAFLAALAAGLAVSLRAPEAPFARATPELADFSLKTPDGQTVSLRDQVGKKPVLLAFWATWCPNCNAAVPSLNAVESGPLGGRVKLLAVDYLESPAKVGAFIRKEGIAYTVLLDGDGLVSRRFGIPGIPTYILIDRGGRIAWRGHALPADLDRLVP